MYTVHVTCMTWSHMQSVRHSEGSLLHLWIWRRRSRYHRNAVIAHSDIWGTNWEDHTALGNTLNAVMLKRTITFQCWCQCLPNGQLVCKYVIKSVRQSASHGSSQWYTCWADILSSCLLLGLLGYTLTAHILCGCNWGIPTGHLLL